MAALPLVGGLHGYIMHGCSQGVYLHGVDERTAGITPAPRLNGLSELSSAAEKDPSIYSKAFLA